MVFYSAQFSFFCMAHLLHNILTKLLQKEPVMERFEKHLKALSLISEILAEQSGQREILLKILSGLEAQLSFSLGTILLLSLDGKELLIEAVCTKDSPVDHGIRYLWGEGIVGKVVSSGLPMIVPRISQEPLFRDRIHRRRESSQDEISFICAPIKIGSEVVGTLSVDIKYDPALLLEEESRVLCIVSSMIANDVKMRRTAYHEREALQTENLRLRDALGESFRPESIIGSSKSMRDVYLKIHQVSKADTTVLIRGESGTGKELIASAIHYGSPRAGRPYVKVNCSALNENLLESELFGHEKGSFTGAMASRIGRIEEAEGGTLFLDEIGEISHSLQVKLLRFIQEREFQRVGSNTTIKADVRILAATNRNLENAVTEGIFRVDLYYRINVFPIFLPPLRERKEDILPLANHFVEKLTRKINKPVRRIATSAISMLMEYHWPGNIRELENCIEHAIVVCSDWVIHGYDLSATLQTPSANEIKVSGQLKDRIDNLERNMIMDALKHTHGNVECAAKELGITSRMVRYKINKLNINYKLFFDNGYRSDIGTRGNAVATGRYPNN
jgi:Nif-specific regulatory protein